MDKIKVGLIYGGDSPEHDISLMTADSIRDNIDLEKFEIVDIFIDRNGKFDESLLNNIDVAFLAVHGPNCEDGKLQQYLEDNGIKYTGSGVDASQINMAKAMQHLKLDEAGLPVVEFEDFNRSDANLAQEYVLKIGLPVIVKPNNGGSSIGMTKVSNLEKLTEAIEQAFEYNEQIVVEKAVLSPREIEVGVLGNNDLIISNPGEILTHGEFYSYENKYNNPFKTTTKADLASGVAEKIKEMARKAYVATGCRGYARVDFFLDKTGKIYINEINTLPGFTPISMFPKLMEEVGISYKDLTTRIINFALE